MTVSKLTTVEVLLLRFRSKKQSMNGPSFSSDTFLLANISSVCMCVCV